MELKKQIPTTQRKTYGGKVTKDQKQANSQTKYKSPSQICVSPPHADKKTRAMRGQSPKQKNHQLPQKTLRGNLISEYIKQKYTI